MHILMVSTEDSDLGDAPTVGGSADEFANDAAEGWLFGLLVLEP